MSAPPSSPPGHPGIPPTWTSSAKSGVGTSLNPFSRVWFTLSHGILNEIYYPRLDQACIRDLGLLVADGKDYFSEEKRDAQPQVATIRPGVPNYHLVNTCLHGRYRITKDILTDPQRDVLLQRAIFTPLQGSLEDYHLYALLAPHLGNQGAGNDAWIGDYKGVPMLFAQRNNLALALASSAPWLDRSAGYVGFSDGWQDISRNKKMTWSYPQALDGNVALTGEIDLLACQGEFVLALGFGFNPSEAGQHALSSLLDDFDSITHTYNQEWVGWQRKLHPLPYPAQQPGSSRLDLYRVSAAVLKTHEAKRFPGGLIASLSVPWGFIKGDDDLGGYHLVWPRDLVESAGGLLALGMLDDARRVLKYLRATQEAQGNWPQNMWLDGRPYWGGLQMDETAFPILLVDLARRSGALSQAELVEFWPMVRRAAGFLVCNGPVTPQDRWEEDPGFSPFTLAVEIAALLVAAGIAGELGYRLIARYLRQTADIWNENIERWTYVSDTDLARQFAVDGYYVRIAPPDVADAASPGLGFVPIKNRPPGDSASPAGHIVSPDALALVRFGLRSPHDPRILDTLKVIDALLKVDTPFGPAWHRYNDDGYGEHEDGSPFDGTGLGRLWPLLTGERAHYALAAGLLDQAVQLSHTLEAFAGPGGMLPEQVWDSPDIPAKELFFGRPAGSAMPLVWAHAEYIKLCRSLHDGRVFDMPSQTLQRYVRKPVATPYTFWRFNHKCRAIPPGKSLRVELLSPALIHWTSDAGRSTHRASTRDTGLGIHFANLPVAGLPAGAEIRFRISLKDQAQGQDLEYSVRIEEV